MIRRLVERSLTRACRGARSLHEDEEGASLVFAAITLFSLALCTFMVFQGGMVSADRLQMQGAADAAAYSAAVVEANALDSIGQLDDAMSYVHYNLLRYTVDQVVYGTLATFRTHHQTVRPRYESWMMGMGYAPPGDESESGPGIENQPAPKFVLLGDAGDWDERIQRVMRLGGLQGQEVEGLRAAGNGMIKQAAKWELDLHTAARVIMNATPRLAREAAAEVADKNGASHLAFASDLERAFTTSGPDAGFSENDGGSEPGAGVAAESLVYRYQKERTLAVDGGQRYDYPSWFDAPRGRSGSGYSQVRLCWNVNDWAHRDQQEVHLTFPQYPAGAPNGHWHGAHTHWIIEDPSLPIPTPMEHGGISPRGQEKPTGGGSGGGHQMPTDDDPQLHTQAMESYIDPFLPYEPHHASITCPTCNAQKYDGQSMWTEVQKHEGLARSERGDDGRSFQLVFEGGFPRPLALREAALRAGVTVVVWREGSGIGEVLPASEWGVVAAASAQVGLLDREGRVRALQSVGGDEARFGGGLTLRLRDDAQFRNLCYSTDDQKGVRFGARLVPLARELSHLGGGESVAELFKQGGSRWWATSTSGGQGGAAPAGIAALRQWVTVDDAQALKEALWH